MTLMGWWVMVMTPCFCLLEALLLSQVVSTLLLMMVRW